MNIQSQFSGQVPNQPGTSLPALPHQQNMMQNTGGQHNILIMEPGFVKARRFIQERIYAFLMQRQQTQEIAQKKVLDIVKRLEEGLFKTATSKDEYMNLETLETRLHSLIKRIPLNNHNQQHQQQGNSNTSVAIGTMIPTPGVSQTGNSSLTVQSSMDHSFSNGGTTGSFMPNSGSFSSSDGIYLCSNMCSRIYMSRSAPLCRSPIFFRTSAHLRRLASLLQATATASPPTTTAPPLLTVVAPPPSFNVQICSSATGYLTTSDLAGFSQTTFRSAVNHHR